MTKLPTPTIWFSPDCKYKQSQKKMETFWFLRLGFHHTYDSAYDSNFWFSQGHKHPYDSAYDSNFDSVASENQPLASFWFLMRDRENRDHRAKERTNNKLNSHNGVNTRIWNRATFMGGEYSHCCPVHCSVLTLISFCFADGYMLRRCLLLHKRKMSSFMTTMALNSIA